MGKRLYVGGIPFQANEEEIRELFSTIGEVESVKIITDPQTGRSRGFGFVEMLSEDDAMRAISNLNGSIFMEKPLTVNEARPQRQKGRRDYGRGSDRGRRGLDRTHGSRHRKGRR